MANGKWQTANGKLILALIYCQLSAISHQLYAISPRPESARPFGMGNAFGAVANDLNTILFNPAGLATIKQIETSATTGRFLSGDSAPQTEASLMGTFPLQSYKQSWNFGVLGFLLNRTGRPGEDTVTNLGFSWGIHPSASIPKKFSADRIPEGFHTGISFRGREIKRSGDNGSNNFGVGVDLGFLYQFESGDSQLKSGWSAAFAIQEMNTKTISSPVLYRLGVAWRNPQSIFALDFVSQNGEGKLFPGMEIAFFRKLLLLRLGSGDLPGEPRQFVLGLGTVLPPLQIDLAYGFPTGSSSKSNDRILASVTYRFDAPMLVQYLYQERLDEVSKIENKVADLESKKRTLQSAIREQKDLYEAMALDMNQAKSKTGEAQKQLQQMDEKILGRKKDRDKIEEEIRKLQAKKEGVAQKMREKKMEQEKIEVRPPGSPGGMRKHKVVAGDSLRDLAQKYYGDPNKWQIIYEVNESKIIRGVPKEGEELTIP